MGGIIIAGREMPGFQVKNWYETGWSAITEACVRPQSPCADGGVTPYGLKALNKYARRYALRPPLAKYGMNPPLEAVKGLLTQMVFHHDGCYSSAQCWEVLHNERGLSCHFLVDNNGDIYQTIDLAYMAYHAAEYNVPSIGVEISNLGEAAGKTDAYKKHGAGDRKVTTCTINNSKILCFDFTDAQWKAMHALCDALTHFLPNIPIEYPQSSPGQQSLETLTVNGREGGAFSYKGYMGHYHCTFRKWDPGPWNFKKFCEEQRGQRCFPLWTPKADPKPGDRPYVPANTQDLKDQLDVLYAMNEDKSDGGYFPVGPWGEHELWHGGVHLATKDKAQIWSPFPGRIVAARMGQTSDFGSTNFVLVRHDMTVGDASMRFYALYMHLLDETKEKDPTQSPKWITKADGGWQRVLGRKALKPKERDEIWDADVNVALLDEPVEAGEFIGRVGRAGPDSKPQIHFEIFSEKQVLEGDAFKDARLDVWDGSGGGRFCDDTDLLAKIDTSPKDGKLSRDELRNFFTDKGQRVPVRQVVTHNISEWTFDPDWTESLKASAEFHDVSDTKVKEMVDQQITPALWWDDKVADHTKLPTDGLVYHYNPIQFLGYINEKIVEAALTAPPPDTSLTGVTGPAKDVTDDFGDVTGASAFVAMADPKLDPDKDLKLEDMIDGYGQ